MTQQEWKWAIMYIKVFALTKDKCWQQQLSKSVTVVIQSLSTLLMKPNFYVSLSHWLSTTVSLVIIIHTKFSAFWLAESISLIPNCTKTWNFFEFRKTILVQKVEIQNDWKIPWKTVRKKETKWRTGLLVILLNFEFTSD